MCGAPQHLAVEEGYPLCGLPNDPSNEGRALRVLQNEGLIKLKDGTGILATIADITDNPKSFMLELLFRSLWETILMTGASGMISLVFGLPLGLALVLTARGGIAENRGINSTLGAVINGFRSVPFIILLVALIPLTRLIVGTSLGTWAAIVPLAIAATPYYARIAEVSLREVDRGLVDAVRAMGGNRWTIIREVLVPEALPGIVAGFTVTVVTLIGASAMAGAIGAGGLGDLAIRYGYQRFETNVMIAVVIVFIVLVCGIQWLGDRLVARLDHR
ncbi:methionine ABC transporter permease [Rhizobium gallicum]|uniref:methionine ABC transporter permease n=1 Tax=Rhizobium gallicum TaxID=56730 RepID=UPI0023BB1660|nr:methionine ABC transporter permease MetI [Rhizobium gallicum]